MPEKRSHEVDIMQVSFDVCIGELGEASVVDLCVVGRDTGQSAYWGRFGLGWPWLLSNAGGVDRPRRETGDVVGGLLSTEEGVDRLRPWRALAPCVEGCRRGRCCQAEIMDSPAPREVWH